MRYRQIWTTASEFLQWSTLLEEWETIQLSIHPEEICLGLVYLAWKNHFCLRFLGVEASGCSLIWRWQHFTFVNITWRNLTISSTFYNFCPWDLICSFHTSLFNNFSTPSTSQLPCPIAKKFQTISHPIGKSSKINEGHWEMKSKLLWTWTTHCLIQSRILENTHDLVNDTNAAWKQALQTVCHSLCHLTHSNEPP